MALTIATTAWAAPVTVDFTAVIGTGNSVDTANVFGEGYGADLTGQIIVGSVIIDPTLLTQVCGTGAACYRDFGAGAISISFTLNGITSTVVSQNILGSFINRASGSVSISDPSRDHFNYMAVGATGPDGMVQQFIGALFDNATLFSAYGNGDPAAAIGSLASIGNGAGLASGGITFMSPVEHLDARILSIAVHQPAGLPLSGNSTSQNTAVPEPAGLAVFGVALGGLGMTRRKRAN